MANLGPPPPPPPPPGEAALSESAQQIINELKIRISILTPLIAEGNIEAKEQYNELRRPIYDDYVNFNSKMFRPISDQVESIKARIEAEEKNLVAQEALYKQEMLNVRKSLETLEFQRQRYSNNPILLKSIESLIDEAKKKQEKIKFDINLFTKQTQDTIQFLSADLQQTMAHKKELLKKKNEFETILKVIPELKKEEKKKIDAQVETFNISFDELEERLQGIWLHNLKKFLDIADDAKVLQRFMILTNPEIRKSPNVLLSMKDVLGIASGYIIRPQGVPYNDLNPLRGTVIEPENLPFLEMLLQECYELNPIFKIEVEKKAAETNDPSQGLRVFTEEFSIDLKKMAQPPSIQPSSRGHSTKEMEGHDFIASPSSLKPTKTPTTSSSEDPRRSPKQKPPSKKTVEIIEQERRESEDKARASMKREGYHFKRNKAATSTQISDNEQHSLMSTTTLHKTDMPEATSAQMLEMVLARKHLQMLYSLAESFDEQIPLDLTPQDYNNLFEDRIQFIKGNIAAEREMLKEERKHIHESKEALKKLHILVEEIKPEHQSLDIPPTPSEQIEKATTVMGELRQEVVELKQELEESVTPEQILQTEKLAGFGHAYSHYKATHHGTPPSIAEMNRWGDASGLRKNPAWKSTLQQASTLGEQFEQKKATTKKRK